MVPMQTLATEGNDGEECEDYKSNHFLHYLQLHECVGASIAIKTDAVSRYLKTVFEERKTPRNEDNNVKWRVALEDTHILEFQVAIPREGHKYVAHDEQHDGKNVLHILLLDYHKGERTSSAANFGLGKFEALAEDGHTGDQHDEAIDCCCDNNFEEHKKNARQEGGEIKMKR